MAEPIKKKPVFYGYWIVGATLTIQHIVFGAYMTSGIFLNPIEASFGWSRAVISGAYSLAALLAGFSALTGGALADRWGPRVVVTTGVALFGTGFVMLSQLGAVWQWYLFFFLIGLGVGSVEMVPLSTIARWFKKRRTMMTAVAKLGIGTGIMLVPLWTTFLITNHGWDSAYLVLGLLVLTIGLPFSQFLKRDPGKMNLLPYGETNHGKTGTQYYETGLTVRQAVKTWQIWVLCAVYLSNMFCMHTIAVHAVPHAKHLGVPEVQANSMVSVIGAVSLAGRMVFGYLGDRIGTRKSMTLCLTFLVAALVWVQFAGDVWQLYLFVSLYGFNHGGIVTLISPAVAELFGTRSQGGLLGVVVSIGIAASAVSPLISGYLFDVYGTYQQAFMVLLGVAIFGFLMTLILRPVKGGYLGQEQSA